MAGVTMREEGMEVEQASVRATHRAPLVKDAARRGAERAGTASSVPMEVGSMGRTVYRLSQGVHRALGGDLDSSIQAQKGWIETLSDLGRKQKRWCSQTWRCR